jgi:signal transduction histidine kinase
VVSDQDLLQEVWLNLIQNAIKFSDRGGTIAIKINSAGDSIKVMIEDHGVGIRAVDQARIFERFYKGDPSRSKEGNGLGLVIVKKIVEFLKGKVSFESTEGNGTVFMVTLPKTHR